MRPQQKPNRNRGKSSNRKPATGNVVNRVFDSAGPEGKVRGTPQQIIEKYESLARDAQTSGDRVVAENFLQHAEHYARLLSAAMIERDAQQRRENQQDQPQQQHQPQQHQPQQQQPQQQQPQQKPRDPYTPDQPSNAGNGARSGLGVIDPSEMDQPDLVVHTPEDRPTPAETSDSAPRQRTRRPRPPRKPLVEKREEEAASTGSDSDSGEVSAS